MRTDKDFVYFILKTANRYYGFTSYTDEKGRAISCIDKYDQNGNPIPRKFYWRHNRRYIKIHKDAKDETGRSIVEFLRNSPDCEGSPTNSGKSMFKEYNPEKDAADLVSANKARIQAQNIVVNLAENDPESFEKLQFALGYGSSTKSVATWSMMQHAEGRPEDIFRALQDEHLKSKALIEAGLQCNELNEKGFMIYWNTMNLGNSRENAAAKLVDDPELMAAIEEKVASRTGFGSWKDLVQSLSTKQVKDSAHDNGEASDSVPVYNVSVKNRDKRAKSKTEKRVERKGD
jgi:hypothetical protein